MKVLETCISNSDIFGHLHFSDLLVLSSLAILSAYLFFWALCPNGDCLPTRFLDRLKPPSLVQYARKDGFAFEDTEAKKRLRKADPQDPYILKIFAERGERRKSLFKKDQNAVHHAIKEVEMLRLEIQDLKNREQSSERFVSGAFAAVSVAVFQGYFTSVATLGLTVFSLLFVFFGFWRFREFQRNNFEIDCYLRELEYALRPDRGWVNFFFSNRSPVHYFRSRSRFWLLLFFASLILVFLAATNLVCEIPWLSPKSDPSSQISRIAGKIETMGKLLYDTP